MARRGFVCLGVVAVLTTAACGGGGSTSDARSSSGSTATTRATARDLSAAQLRALDYNAALAHPADLEFYGTFNARDAFEMKDTNLRKQCGETAKSPAYAVGGSGLQLVDADGLISLNTGVQAFSDEAAAKNAFAFARRSVEGCTRWSSDGDEFTKVSAPSIPDAGDETLTLFSRKNDTQLLVADHFARRGQFVFNLRYAVDGTSALAGSPGALSEIARADDERFVAWADQQQS